MNLSQHRKRVRTVLLAMALVGIPLLGARAGGCCDTMEPRLTVPRAWTDNPIVIDGDLRDRAWEQGTMTYGFRSEEDHTSVRDFSRARIIYDYHALYVGFTSVDADADPLVDLVQNEPGALPGGDFLGLFLEYPLDNGDLYALKVYVDRENHVLVSQNGKLVSIKGIESAVNRREGVWDVEVKLPWSVLGTEMPRFGDVWKADFLRHRTAPRRDDPAMSVWVPGEGMGELRFGRDLLVYLYSKRPYHSSDEIMVYNYSDRLRRLSGEYYNEDGELVMSATVHLGPGHRRQHYRMEGLPKKGTYKLIVRDRDVMDGADPVMMVVPRMQF